MSRKSSKQQEESPKKTIFTREKREEHPIKTATTFPFSISNTKPKRHCTRKDEDFGSVDCDEKNNQLSSNDVDSGNINLQPTIEKIPIYKNPLVPAGGFVLFEPHK